MQNVIFYVRLSRVIRHGASHPGFKPQVTRFLLTGTAAAFPEKTPLPLEMIIFPMSHSQVCSCQHDRWPWYWLEVDSKRHRWVRWRISIRVLSIRVLLKGKLSWVTCSDVLLLQRQTLCISPIVYSQEELWARIPKGHGAKWIEKRLLNSRMCVWVCSELCRCQASCDVSSFMSKRLTPEMIMPEQKWIILPFVGKGWETGWT